MLGDYALTAVVNSNIFMYMMMGAVMGIGLAAGVAIGQSIGSGDAQAVRRVVGTSITAVAGFGILVAAAGWMLAPVLLDRMHVPESGRDAAITYLRLICLQMPSMFVYIVMMMTLRGTGDAKTPFRFTLLWIGLGLALSPILLTGAFGLPRLGIAGVAIGALLANALALLALVVTLYRRDVPIALRGADLRHFVPDLRLLWLLMKRAAPMALESFIVQGSYFVLLSMVNEHGAMTAAAYSGAAQLWSYVQMPSQAVASSMAAMAAMNIGAARWPRVESIALKGCALGVAVTSLAALLIYALGDRPLLLFLPQGGETLQKAHDINAIVVWGWIAVSITSGLAAVVRANSAMLAPTLIFAITMWVFRVPFAMALEPVLGEAAIWWSFPVGTISSALLAWGYFRWGGWRDNPLMMSRVKKA